MVVEHTKEHTVTNYDATAAHRTASNSHDDDDGENNPHETL